MSTASRCAGFGSVHDTDTEALLCKPLCRGRIEAAPKEIERGRCMVHGQGMGGHGHGDEDNGVVGKTRTRDTEEDLDSECG